MKSRESNFAIKGSKKCLLSPHQGQPKKRRETTKMTVEQVKLADHMYVMSKAIQTLFTSNLAILTLALSLVN